MGSLQQLVTPPVTDSVSQSPTEPFWFDTPNPSVIPGVFTTWYQLGLFIDAQGESWERFEDYLADGSTPYSTYNGFLGNGTETDLTTWWAANP